MDGLQNFLLFLLAYTDAIKGLARATIRTDQRFSVCSGKCRMTGVTAATKGADPNLVHFLFHRIPSQLSSIAFLKIFSSNPKNR